jgi:hypothetical protein
LRFPKLKVKGITHAFEHKEYNQPQTIPVNAEIERERDNYLEGLLHRLERYPTSCSKAAFEAFF